MAVFNTFTEFWVLHLFTMVLIIKLYITELGGRIFFFWSVWLVLSKNFRQGDAFSAIIMLAATLSAKKINVSNEVEMSHRERGETFFWGSENRKA